MSRDVLEDLVHRMQDLADHDDRDEIPNLADSIILEYLFEVGDTRMLEAFEALPRN